MEMPPVSGQMSRSRCSVGRGVPHGAAGATEALIDGKRIQHLVQRDHGTQDERARGAQCGLVIERERSSAIHPFTLAAPVW